MFAVPGWSVPSQVKTQTLPAPAVDSGKQPGNEGGLADEGTSNRKRKREQGEKNLVVTEKNFADLWESVIEKQPRPSKKQRKLDKEKRLEGKPASTETPAVGSAGQADAETTPAEVTPLKKKKTLKEKKREKKARLANSETPVQNAQPAPKKINPPAAKAPQLTPLQAAMRQKLISARFRHLNETLYTTPSAKSFELFQESPQMFQEYHEGFRQQVEVWPENPVDSYLQEIKTRGKLRASGRGHTAKPDAETSLLPLPRTDGTCHVADLGCGDAALAQGLQAVRDRLQLTIRSYDLQAPSSLVTKADIANLPLKDNSIDAAIFCLALMGTNWIDFIEEAFRILRWKGELWVAEIKSRFGRVGGKGSSGGSGGRVEHSVGNRKKAEADGKKKSEEHDNARLAVEVDGQEHKQETDVAAFVEVLRKRGFVLQGEQAVDLSNRMFVKMRFLKAGTPIKGKGVPVPKGMEKAGVETWARKPKTKFLEAEEVPVSREAAVLKPCVYKLR